MKNTGKFAKIVSMVLCVAVIVLTLASCGKNDAAFTFTMDGKDYTVTEGEFDFLMMYSKYQILSNSGLSAAYDQYLWEDDETDKKYTDIVKETAKTIVVEKYLMEKFGLELDAEEIEELKKQYKDSVKFLGGEGSFKKYYGWTSDQMYQYDIALKNQNAIKDYLYNEETGVEKVTEEELEEYYTENFRQYLIIMIDTKQDIAKDDEGNKKYIAYDKEGNEIEITDISEEYLEENEYTLAYSYKYEEIESEERKEEKASLADIILSQLKDGADFKELALKYSDEFLTEYFEEGYIVEGDLMSDEDAKEKIDALEVGEYTEEAISLESGEYIYIVKRVELEEKAYTQADEGAENTEYAVLFEDYHTTVSNDKYEKFLEEYVSAVTVNEEIVGKYKMSTTKLSSAID